jgi:hypothetical protein
MVRPILLAGLVAILPTIVQAQGRAMASGGVHVMAAAAPRMVAPVAHALGAPGMTGARPMARTGMPPTRPGMIRTRRPVGTPRHFVADGREHKPGCSNVPGLGFDAVHLAAVCGPGAFGGGRGGNVVPFFFPFFDGGFYVPSAPAVAEQGASAEPQQTEDTEADVAERPRRTRTYASAQRQENESASAGPIESQEFVFVRRDGTVFFAVAYSWESGTLRYITSEGLRRNVARDSLDLVATQQFNEQRGVNFRLPA